MPLNHSQFADKTLSLFINRFAVVDRRYLGCYQDQNEDRVFPSPRHYANPREYCIKECKDNHYSLSGTQVGQ